MRRLLLACVVIALAGLAGCGDFDLRWKKAAQQSPKEVLMGRWEGTWTSQSDSNSGLLRCIITKTAPGKYNAEFHATYWGLLTFTMPVALEGAFRDDKWQFKGQKDLGVLAGGVYTYEGWADEDTFYSTYDSSYERGVFEMKRVDQFSQPLTQPTTEPQGGT